MVTEAQPKSAMKAKAGRIWTIRLEYVIQFITDGME